MRVLAAKSCLWQRDSHRKGTARGCYEDPLSDLTAGPGALSRAYAKTISPGCLSRGQFDGQAFDGALRHDVLTMRNAQSGPPR